MTVSVSKVELEKTSGNFSSRLDPLVAQFRCPHCGAGGLRPEGHSLACDACGVAYPVDHGVPMLLTESSVRMRDRELSSSTGRAMEAEYSSRGGEVDEAASAPGALQRLANLVRPPSVMYHFNPDLGAEHTADLFTHAGVGTTRALNVGGGPHRYSGSEITMNLKPFHNVDMVGDAHNIPFMDDTFDTIICNAVLEHVRDPSVVVAEMIRVLKPGGILYAEVPYIFFFHGYPNDFQRFTIEGMRHLFRDLGEAEFGITNGPVSAVLQSVNIVLQMLVPRGTPRAVVKVGNGLFRWLTFYLKYLDIPICKRDDAHLVAGGFYVLGRKSGPAPEGETR